MKQLTMFSRTSDIFVSVSKLVQTYFNVTQAKVANDL